MNQIATSPVVVLRHNTSLLPSPSKSPVSATIQLLDIAPRPALDEIDAPFISQIAVLPSAARQSKSALPSPLKSPVATIDQLVATLPMLAALPIVPPLRSQIAA